MDKIRISIKVAVKHPSFFERLARLRWESVAVIESLPNEAHESAHQAHDGGDLGELRLMTRRESEWEAYMNPFKFVLRNAWVRICLTDSTCSSTGESITDVTNKSMSDNGGYLTERGENVSVEFSSLALATVGFPAMWERWMNWIENNVGDVIGTKVSRLDLKVDLAGLEVRRTLLRSLVSRARLKESYLPEVKESYRGNALKGFTVGKRGKGGSGIYFRLYDKRREMTESKTAWWYGVWKSATGIDYEHDHASVPVARAEFELSRRVLKKFGIETVQDVGKASKVMALWKHLTTKFIRLVRRSDKNISRCPALAIWKKVQQASFTIPHDASRSTRSMSLPMESGEALHGAGRLKLGVDCLAKHLSIVCGQAKDKMRQSVLNFIEKTIKKYA